MNLLLTQKELDEEYVDGPAAAKILNVTSNQVRFLCANGRLKGAMKLGTSGWIIPRISVINYKPQKRGPKKNQSKVEQDKNFIKEILKKIKNGEKNDE